MHSGMRILLIFWLVLLVFTDARTTSEQLLETTSPLPVKEATTDALLKHIDDPEHIDKAIIRWENIKM